MSAELIERGTDAAIVVSVLVPSFNTRDLLRRCLTTVFGSVGAFSLEVIVIDDGSNDGTSEMVKSEFPSVKLIRNETSKSFAPAINQGLALSTGERVLLLNSDIELPEDALDRLLSPQADGVVAVVPLLRSPHGDPQREYTFRKLPRAGDVALNLLMFSRLPRALRRRFGWDSSDVSLEVDTDVEQPSAACILFDGAVLRELGGMDEALPLWFNDVDLCKRVAARGYRIRFLHDVSVVHLGGATISRLTNPSRVERLYVDSMTYVRKWHPRAVPLFRVVILVNLIVRSVATLVRPRHIRAWFAALPRLFAPITRRT